jgi:hypothetical protein
LLLYHGLPADLYRFEPKPGSYVLFLGRISAEKHPDAAIRDSGNSTMRIPRFIHCGRAMPPQRERGSCKSNFQSFWQPPFLSSQIEVLQAPLQILQKIRSVHDEYRK